mmetsp:Transcript_459/g.1574  ORF Transcript_459/g.1574 Transcript_459/m.1574 type:complete len:304 (+) Transcript_459:203-1114(+)
MMSHLASSSAHSSRRSARTSSAKARSPWRRSVDPMDFGAFPEPSIVDCAPPWPLRVVYRANVRCASTRPAPSKSAAANLPDLKATTHVRRPPGRLRSAASLRSPAAADACVSALACRPPTNDAAPRSAALRDTDRDAHRPTSTVDERMSRGSTPSSAACASSSSSPSSSVSSSSSLSSSKASALASDTSVSSAAPSASALAKSASVHGLRPARRRFTLALCHGPPKCPTCSARSSNAAMAHVMHVRPLPLWLSATWFAAGAAASTAAASGAAPWRCASFSDTASARPASSSSASDESAASWAA